MPVFLDSDLVLVDPERAQLGEFAKAALELGKASEPSQPDDVLPQFKGLLGGSAAG